MRVVHNDFGNDPHTIKVKRQIINKYINQKLIFWLKFTNSDLKLNFSYQCLYTILLAIE